LRSQKIRFYAMTLLATMALCAGYGRAQSPAAGDPKQQPQAPADPPPARLEGFGTLGQIPKFGGGNNIINSVITEDFSGRIGVGTREPGSRLTVVGLIESTNPGGGYKFPDGTVQLTAGLSADQVVRSINNLRGDLTLQGGPGITVTPSGNFLNLAIANVAVGTAQLADSAVSTAKLADLAVGTAKLASAAVTAPKLNTLTAPSAGQFLGFNGSSLVWQTAAGFNGVVTDATLAGNGTDGAPLKINVPLTLTGSVFGRPILEAVNADTNSTGIRGIGGRPDFPLFGGIGVEAFGGNAIPGISGSGGEGIFAVGGEARGSGNIGGNGIAARGGVGFDGAESGLAGAFVGNVRVTGNLEVTGTKNFKIDHPLDPENKYLYHAAVESSEVLNVYSGNVVTDAGGEASVTLPDWFEAINRDVRYQLTVVGTFAQAIVAGEVQNNQFTIRTSAPQVKVSWQVTGVRSDAVMKQNPFKIEVEKSERERGRYLVPEAFDRPEDRSVEWARHPELMRQMKGQQGRVRLKR